MSAFTFEGKWKRRKLNCLKQNQELHQINLVKYYFDFKKREVKMYVVKMRGGYMCANAGATRQLKFATIFATKTKAEDVAQKWLRSDESFKVVEKESEELLLNEKRVTGYISRSY